LPEPFALGPGEWVASPATFIGVYVARLDVPAARLRVVARHGVGVDDVDLEAAKAKRPFSGVSQGSASR
jgi:lactate dehydrogenase-like 2-hydroxyacid dehydrogenase